MENFCEFIMVTFFGGVIQRPHWNHVITHFLKFDFVIISLKKHNLGKSRNFRSPKSRVRSFGGVESLALDGFEKLLLK